MKKIITLFTFTIIVASAMAQYTIRNHSFENWSPNGTGMWPDQWDAYDSSETAQAGLLQRRAGGSDGNYSIKMSCYDDGSIVLTGAWLIMEDTIPFAPQALALDYIIPQDAAFLTTIRINLYFYDENGDLVDAPSWNLTEKSNGFLTGIRPLSFSGAIPKSYAMDIKFQNINGDPGDYVVVDNVRFLETYTPPTTGLTEIKTPVVAVYPNPAHNQLYLSNTPVSIHTCNILRTDGSTVLQTSVTESIVDIASIPAGMYFIIMLDKDGSVIGRSRFCKSE